MKPRTLDDRLGSTLSSSDIQRGVICSPWHRIRSQVLRTGVDRLYLSYAGDLKPELQETLETLKLLAQSETSKEQAKAALCLANLLSDILIQPPKITHCNRDNLPRYIG